MINKIGGINCYNKWKWWSYLIRLIDFMNKIIDARCYFTSKCKISPRVIYFIHIFSGAVVFWARSNLLWCFSDFLIDTSHYNYRQIRFFYINGMFSSMWAYLLHATVIGRITFPLKMVCFLSILAFYFTLII